MKVTWDDEVPPEISAKWKRARKDLMELNALTILKLVSEANSITDEIQLHGFGDASEATYGACIYLRSRNNNQYVTHLLISKSRIAPEKATTLPPLELYAAVLLARLYYKVKSAFTSIQKSYFWTDSTIAPAWLESPSSH